MRKLCCNVIYRIRIYAKAHQLLTEVSIVGVSDLEKQREQRVECLQSGVIPRGNVHEIANHVDQLRQFAIELRQIQLQFVQFVLHLSRPLLHQIVDVRHRAAHVHGWRMFAPVQLIDVVDPLVDRPAVSLGVLDSLDNRLSGGASASRVTSQLQMQDRRIRLVGTGLVKHRQTDLILDTVGSRHFYEGVYVADRRYVVRNERYQLVR